VSRLDGPAGGQPEPYTATTKAWANRPAEPQARRPTLPADQVESTAEPRVVMLEELEAGDIWAVSWLPLSVKLR